MTTLITPYDSQAATELGRSAAEMRLGQVQHELDEEYEVALALAGEYADHLATGGDPTIYPQPGRDARHGLARIAREGVFTAWNASRERQSVSYPWGQGMPYRWLVQEYLLASLGQPIPTTELAALGRGNAKRADVADAAWSLQVATNGEVRVRKTEVDGKVAWLARPPIECDDTIDLLCREGVLRSSLSDMTDAEIAEATRRPFRQQVYAYPTEAL